MRDAGVFKSSASSARSLLLLELTQFGANVLAKRLNSTAQPAHLKTDNLTLTGQNEQAEEISAKFR